MGVLQFEAYYDATRVIWVSELLAGFQVDVVDLEGAKR